MSASILEGLLAPHQLGEHAALPGVPVARPEDVEQARELFALARRDRKRLVLMGSGTKLGWSVLAARPDFALSTTTMSGITEFEPGDGTLTARAGTTMAELQRAARAAGLSVTPDVARAGEATLGGVIGAGASGADRLTRGPARRHLLGTRALQLDGNSTRSGGNLVKNVTGYDLQRLYCGAFGSLVLVVEASLRLFPEPATTAVASVGCAELELCLERADAVLGAQVSSRAVTIVREAGEATFVLYVVLTGLPEHVELELERVLPHLGEAHVLRGDPAAELRDQLREREPDPRAGTVLHLAARPSRLRAVVGELFDALGSHLDAPLVLQPGLATLDLLHDFGDDDQERDLLGRLGTALAPLGAQASLRAARPLAAGFAQPSPDPLRAALSERLRRTFDPEGLLCTHPPLGAAR